MADKKHLMKVSCCCYFPTFLSVASCPAFLTTLGSNQKIFLSLKQVLICVLGTVRIPVEREEAVFAQKPCALVEQAFQASVRGEDG